MTSVNAGSSPARREHEGERTTAAVRGEVVESTATTRSRSPSASARASRAVKSFSQVPSAAHFRSRLWAPFHEPKCPGRSVHDVPVTTHINRRSYDPKETA